MKTTSAIEAARQRCRDWARPGPARRLAASGLAVVMATSLYACGVAQADEHISATAPPITPNATATSEVSETPEADPEKTSDGTEAEETPGSTPAVVPTNNPAASEAGERAANTPEPPAAPNGPAVVTPPGGGRPAVIRNTGKGEEERSTRAAVALNEIARPTDGIEVTVREARSVKSQGEVPGYRYGPAVVLKISVRNATEGPISTLGSTVTVVYGPDRRPADPSPQADDSLLPAEIAAGQVATGTYTFLIPEDGRDEMSVTVSYRSTDPAVVLEGPARLVGQGR